MKIFFHFRKKKRMPTKLKIMLIGEGRIGKSYLCLTLRHGKYGNLVNRDSLTIWPVSCDTNSGAISIDFYDVVSERKNENAYEEMNGVIFMCDEYSSSQDFVENEYKKFLTSKSSATAFLCINSKKNEAVRKPEWFKEDAIHICGINYLTAKLALEDFLKKVTENFLLKIISTKAEI